MLWLSNKVTVTIYCGGGTLLYLQLASHLLKRIIGYHQSNSLKVKKPKNHHQTKRKKLCILIYCLSVKLLSSELLVNNSFPYSHAHYVII